jgi:hypothetical protein
VGSAAGVILGLLPGTEKDGEDVDTTYIPDGTKDFTPFVRPSHLLPNDSAGRNARELWWTSQELSSASIISPWFSHAHISRGDEQ